MEPEWRKKAQFEWYRGQFVFVRLKEIRVSLGRFLFPE